MHLWREFGLAIGLKPSTLEAIKSNYLKEVEICFTEVLASWLNGEDRSRDSPAGPNWEEVIAVLKSPSLNMRDCAHQLIQKLTGIGVHVIPFGTNLLKQHKVHTRPETDSSAQFCIASGVTSITLGQQVSELPSTS